MTLNRTVVLGFDGSDRARAALELATRRAGPAGRIVAVFAAAMNPEAALGLPPGAPVMTPPTELGEQILGRIPEGDVPVRRVVRAGHPAHVLADVARELEADEIVVGSHGAGRLRALLGSTSHGLVHTADRPVVVLNERAAERGAGPGDPAHLIVVGYDGSDHARAALDYARRHLAPGGEIHAVHAYHAPAEWKGSRAFNAALEERLARGEQIIGEIQDLPQVRGELVAGAPAETLARIAAVREADEIVVGSRGHGTLRAALGSVSHAILHDADRPVVIVPRH